MEDVIPVNTILLVNMDVLLKKVNMEIGGSYHTMDSLVFYFCVTKILISIEIHTK
jgi:hypothetical protein